MQNCREKPMLAHPAAPLATKIGGHGNGLEVLEYAYWKTDFSLIIYSPSSTNPENLVKISLVDCETTGLTGILKIIFLKETEAEHTAGPALTNTQLDDM